jgi:hypothetical protein
MRRTFVAQPGLFTIEFFEDERGRVLSVIELRRARSSRAVILNDGRGVR